MSPTMSTHPRSSISITFNSTDHPFTVTSRENNVKTCTQETSRGGEISRLYQGQAKVEETVTTWS